MKTRKSSKSENVTDVEKTNEETKTEGKKLLREVHELRLIIEQCKWSLDTLRFKEVDCTTKRQGPKTSRFVRKTPNVEVKLQNDLYRFAGFRCVKFRREELVFNFASTNERQRDNTHAVQIFIKGGKGNLGKWAMPMSVDMNQMLTRTPIDELRNLPAFVKSCKHNVDCYVVRQEQFLSLKKYISDMKHCTLQTNIGYTQISLELLSVRDNENDKYINLIIYLLYHPGEARPHKVKIDTTDKRQLSDDTGQRLKVYLKKFKKSDLKTAFDKVLAENESAFTWMQTDDSESPLELNDSSGSDENNYLAQLQWDRKKSLRQNKRKRELQKKWNERKRERSTIENNTSLEDENEDSHHAAKVSHTESPKRTLTKRKKTEKIDRVDKSLLKETTPMNKPINRLKQTKLNFQTNQATNSDSENKSPLFESKTRTNFRDKKQTAAKLFTSTPLFSRHISIPSPSSLEINNITDIESSPKQTANKLNDSRNSRRSRDESTSEIKTRRSLRSNIKPAKLSLRDTTDDGKRKKYITRSRS